MNRKKLFVANSITIMETRFQKFDNSIFLAIFLKSIIYTYCGFMLCDLFHAKLVWMLSVSYIPNCLLQN